MVVDRGLLDLDTPICHYWPEFAAGGKEKATVRHALSHMTGAPGLAVPQPDCELNDFVKAAALVAAEPAWFEPGSDWCYHALTYGLILGELVRRVDGRSPSRFLQNEIAIPLQADFSFGVRADTPFSRISTTIMTDEDETEEGSLYERIMSSFSVNPTPVCWNVLARENPSTSGYGNARSIARIVGIIANGGVLDGRRYLSEDLIREALTPQYQGDTEMFGAMSFGLGFGLDNPGFPSPVPSPVHWGGLGGYWVVIDPDKKLTVAYTMNRGMMPGLAEKGGSVVMDPRQARFWRIMSELIQIL